MPSLPGEHPHKYVQVVELVEAETVIAVLVTKPLMDKVGLAAIDSEKVAEKVTLV